MHFQPVMTRKLSAKFDPYQRSQVGLRNRNKMVESFDALFDDAKNR